MFEKPDVKIAVLVGITLAFLLAIGNLYWHMEHMRVEMASLRHSVLDEVTKLTDATHQAQTNSRRAPASAETSRKVLDSLKEELTAELTTTQRQAAAAAARAKEALNHADTLAERMGEERQSQHKEVIGQLGQMKQTEATTSAKVEGVAADVANIKNDVASTRYELEQTVGALKRINGDLGVQSGYIATNAKELQALKMMGERNYFEFRVGRTGKAERVGDVAILLRKTDTKRNKYSMDVVAGDKRTEKKEKGVNEPVQFYLTRARAPFEIVVNEVQKDFIVGYLSTPKELVAHTD
jgi:DNA repair exonuclease SbcCD ATPase subunit